MTAQHETRNPKRATFAELLARVAELEQRMNKLAMSQAVLKLAIADQRRQFEQEVNRQRRELGLGNDKITHGPNNENV